MDKCYNWGNFRGVRRVIDGKLWWWPDFKNVSFTEKKSCCFQKNYLLHKIQKENEKSKTKLKKYYQTFLKVEKSSDSSSSELVQHQIATKEDIFRKSSSDEI